MRRAVVAMAAVMVACGGDGEAAVSTVPTTVDATTTTGETTTTTESATIEVAEAAPTVTVTEPTTIPPNSVARSTVPFAAAEPVVTDDVWWSLALCECNGNATCDTGNGYYGTYQFLPETWWGVGGTGLPHEHSYAEQKHRAQLLQARSGWGQWPACSRKLGLQ